MLPGRVLIYNNMYHVLVLYCTPTFREKSDYISPPACTSDLEPKPINYCSFTYQDASFSEQGIDINGKTNAKYLKLIYLPSIFEDSRSFVNNYSNTWIEPVVMSNSFYQHHFQAIAI